MYSDIIDAAEYIRIMEQHVYMKAADGLVTETALGLIDACGDRIPLIAEIGCGPGRVTSRLMGARAEVVGLDIDPTYLAWAKKRAPAVEFVHADLRLYTHPKLADVVVSHGFHHHIDHAYLKRLVLWVKPGGYYVLSDEFLPHYRTAEERQLRAVVWYAHVVGSALASGHQTLALEEAKTLLDDLWFGSEYFKTEAHIRTVLELAPGLNGAIKQKDYARAQSLGKSMLESLSMQTHGQSERDRLLSRGDYKICHRELCEQLVGTGFELAGVQTIGPINLVGGFAAYVLQRV